MQDRGRKNTYNGSEGMLEADAKEKNDFIGD